MANLAEALKSSIPAEAPSADPIAPVPTPDIADEIEADAAKPDPEPDDEETGKKPDPEKKPPDQVPWKALKSERDKRQKAESELAYLRGRVDGQPGKQEEEPSDDDLDNEFLLSPSATLNSRMEKKVDQAMRDHRANVSDAAMRREAEDYPELLEEFVGLANANPELWQRASVEMEPARAIYNFMKSRKDPPRQVDEKKLREEIRAEIEEENKKKAAIEEAENTPTTPAGIPGGGEAPAGKFKTVDDLFAERRRAVGR